MRNVVARGGDNRSESTKMASLQIEREETRPTGNTAGETPRGHPSLVEQATGLLIRDHWPIRVLGLGAYAALVSRNEADSGGWAESGSRRYDTEFHNWERCLFGLQIHEDGACADP